MSCMNPPWIEHLPKTPAETDNENEHEPEIERKKKLKTRYVYDDTLINEEDEEDIEDYAELQFEEAEEDSSSNNSESDDDEISSSQSEDDYYNVISMDKAIQINLSRIQIDKFHSQILQYFDNTRASAKICTARYSILCLINDIWQQMLIQREFAKNHFPIRQKDIENNPNVKISKIYDSNLHYKAYKIYDGTYMTPCHAPKQSIQLYDDEGNIIYDKVIPSAKIFGSICTRLDGAGSDMDITLPNSVDNPVIDIWFNKNEQKSKLSEFLQILNSRKNEWSEQYKFDIFPVLNAKVPIIKIKEIKSSMIEMDIAIQSSQQSVANLINFYCDYDDRVRPFIIAIKYWSKCRGICDAMSNYPNSFGFVLLCVKFLQMVNILPICSLNDENDNVDVIADVDYAKYKNCDTLLELMVQFFEMYHRFNFKLLQISTSRIGLESKTTHEFYSNFKYLHQTTMVVEDPSCRSSNVTRNVRPYRLTIMKNEFLRGYKCAKHGNWKLLMHKFEGKSDNTNIFDVYPPSDDEQEYLANKILDGDDDEDEYDDYDGTNDYDAGYEEDANAAEMEVTTAVIGDIINHEDEIDDDGKQKEEEDEEEGQYGKEGYVDVTTQIEPNEYVINTLCSRGRGRGKVRHSRLENVNIGHKNCALKLSKVLTEKLDNLLLDADILRFWGLSPFRNGLFDSLCINMSVDENIDIDTIDLYLNNYQISMGQFVQISKFYLIQFNLQFIKYYDAEINFSDTMNEALLFDTLQYQDTSELYQKLKKIYKNDNKQNGLKFQIKCLEKFSKLNNEKHWKMFLNEMGIEGGQNIMPSMLKQQIAATDSNEIIYGYSWYISFISLFSFWKSLFDEIDNNAAINMNTMNTNMNIKRRLSVSRLSNKEWVISKIRHAMNAVGLQHLSQIQLFKLLK